jgi:8-hydroxy-5-deazaflavin:NADPH oxidoreductase
LPKLQPATTFAIDAVALEFVHGPASRGPSIDKESHMKIGIIGSGTVAQTLAAGFLKHGHAVMLGTRQPAQLAEFAAAQPKARVGSVNDAAAFAELAVLAVKGTAAIDALRGAAAALAGKTVIDTTNPIADTPPAHGVLAYFTGPNDSLLERLQREFPALKFVKAFNSVGAACMVDPQLAGGPPTMFIAGDDAGAKATVAGVLDQFGWGVADMGHSTAARAIEPLCMLWCIPGFASNDWVHAFKLLR